MKNKIYKNVKFILGIICFIFIISITLLCNVIIINATDDITEIDQAYYRIDKKVIKEELQYSLTYEQDQAYTLVKNQEDIVGKACGGDEYGLIAFNANQEYSQSSHILTIPNSDDFELVSWSVNKYGKWTDSTILNIAKDYENNHPGYKVVAGINGDFFDNKRANNYTDAVLGMTSTDGDVIRVGSNWQALKLNNEEKNRPLLKVENPTVTDKPVLSIFDTNGNIIFTKKLDTVNNSELINGQTGVFFGNYNSDHECEELSVNNAYVVNQSLRQFAFSNESFYGKGIITDYGDYTLGENQFAIITKDAQVEEKLKIGVTIRVQYEFTNELENAKDVCGVVCTFLKNGTMYTEDRNYSYMQYRYPRTLIGYKENGEIVMAVTDGRQPEKGYYGLNGFESAAQMIHYGCIEAYSFDGGGSTTMVILQDGELKSVNSPSDGSLRCDGNAILVVAKAANIELDYKIDENSIEFIANIVELSEKYRDLYIECNGIRKQFKNNKALFDELTVYTDYIYRIYAKTDDKYILLPFVGKISTSKAKFVLDDITLELIDNGIEKYYELSYKLNDPNSSISNIALYVNNKRVSSTENGFKIIFQDSCPLEYEYKLLIKYEYNSIEGNIDEYRILDNIDLKNAITTLSLINQKIYSIFDNMLQ